MTPEESNRDAEEAVPEDRFVQAEARPYAGGNGGKNNANGVGNPRENLVALVEPGGEPKVQRIPSLKKAAPTWPVDNRASKANFGYTEDRLYPRFTAKQIAIHTEYSAAIEEKIRDFFEGDGAQKANAEKTLNEYVGKRTTKTLSEADNIWNGTKKIRGLRDRLGEYDAAKLSVNPREYFETLINGLDHQIRLEMGSTPRFKGEVPGFQKKMQDKALKGDRPITEPEEWEARAVENRKTTLKGPTGELRTSTLEDIRRIFADDPETETSQAARDILEDVYLDLPSSNPRFRQDKTIFTLMKEGLNSIEIAEQLNQLYPEEPNLTPATVRKRIVRLIAYLKEKYQPKRFSANIGEILRAKQQ